MYFHLYQLDGEEDNPACLKCQEKHSYSERKYLVVVVLCVKV